MINNVLYPTQTNLLPLRGPRKNAGRRVQTLFPLTRRLSNRSTSMLVSDRQHTLESRPDHLSISSCAPSSIRAMEYHERHGHDVSSFDLPSTRKCPCSRSTNSISYQTADDLTQDRLPTVSAAEALDELNGDALRQISTSLPGLDRALTGNASSLLTEQDGKGGIQKGQVTEIWGPPGVGKTALG